MKKTFLSLALIALSAVGFAQGRYALVHVSAANLRAEPDYESPLETQALMGSAMEVLDSSGYWLKVHLLEPEYVAWVNRLQVTRTDSPQYSPDLICSAKYSTVYARPSERSSVICDLVRGDVMQQARSKKGKALRKRGFRSVILPSGTIGWTPDYEVEPIKTVIPLKASATAIVEEALSYLGTPYLWGGTTVKGFDCSGLVRQCYLMEGISLPRNASEQLHCGEELDVTGVLEGKCDHLRPGDLLFFGNRETGRVSHVAIYTGNGHIVHSSMVVRHNSLLEGEPDYYENAWRLLYAKRIIQ